MIELVLALGLLLYVILDGMETILSKETFEKIIYHSKATQIIAQIISLLGIITIAFGLMTFISIIILSVIGSGSFEKTIIENGWDKKPEMMFLTVIGALALIILPLILARFLPSFGGKKRRN